MERTLKKGMIGPEVLMLQETLNKHGYRVQTNGFFGIFTDEAVHNFQTRHGLVSDGIVGFRTRSALGLDRLPVRQTGLLYHQRMGSNHPLGHPPTLQAHLSRAHSRAFSTM
jgi:murein L,D-transpeptidase YcbB/YkuD